MAWRWALDIRKGCEAVDAVADPGEAARVGGGHHHVRRGTASGKTSVIVSSSSRKPSSSLVIGETGQGSLASMTSMRTCLSSIAADVLEHGLDGVADHDPDVDAGGGPLGDHVERR